MAFTFPASYPDPSAPRPVLEVIKAPKRNRQTSIDIVCEVVFVSKNTEKKLPVLVNARQIETELQLPHCRIHTAIDNGEVVPDFVDLRGKALFRASRLPQIAQLLAKPEVLA